MTRGPVPKNLAGLIREADLGAVPFYVTEHVRIQDALVALIISRMDRANRQVGPEYGRVLVKMTGSALLSQLCHWSAIAELSDEAIWMDLEYQASKLEKAMT
jgi:hypothetical protein